MGPIAGQTARPNGLKFFEGTHAYQRTNSIYFFISRATPGISVSIEYIIIYGEVLCLFEINLQNFPNPIESFIALNCEFGEIIYLKKNHSKKCLRLMKIFFV